MAMCPCSRPIIKSLHTLVYVTVFFFSCFVQILAVSYSVAFIFLGRVKANMSVVTVLISLLCLSSLVQKSTDSCAHKLLLTHDKGQ